MRRTYIRKISYSDVLTDTQRALKESINNVAPIVSYEIGNTVVDGMVDASITVRLFEFDPLEIYHVDEAVIKNKDTTNRLPVYVANINGYTIIFVYKSTEDVIRDIYIKVIGKNKSGEYNATVVDTPYNHYVFTGDISSYSIYKEEIIDIKVVTKKYENEDFIKRSLSLFLDTQNIKIIDGNPSDVNSGTITRIDYEELLALDGFKYLITAPKYRDSGKCYILPVVAHYTKEELERIVTILRHDELHTIN